MPITLTPTLIPPTEPLGTPREDVVFIIHKTVTTEPVTTFSRMTIVEVQNYLTYLYPQINLMLDEPAISNAIQEEWDRYNDILTQMNVQLDTEGFV